MSFRNVVRKVIGPRDLTSILAGFQDQIEELEQFMEQNGGKVDKLQAEINVVLHKQKRAQRVADKLKDLLS